MDGAHDLVGGEAVAGGVEIGRGDIKKADEAAATVHAHQHRALAFAERAEAIDHDGERSGVGGRDGHDGTVMAVLGEFYKGAFECRRPMDVIGRAGLVHRDGRAGELAMMPDVREGVSIEVGRGGERVLRAGMWLARPIDAVFKFFGDAGNLEAITPPWLGFDILTPKPIEMGVGTLIDYRIRLKGVPMRWRTRIAAWEPPTRFIDEQLKGPYALWEHEHRFRPESRDVQAGTWCEDVVRYRVPMSGLTPWLGVGRVADRIMVRRDLRRIFEYRMERMRGLLG